MNFKLGDILEGKIVDFTHEGKGVVKIDKFIIFVLGGVIGDKVSFKITKKKKNFAEAEVIEVLEASEDRVENTRDIKEAMGVIPLVEYDYKKGLEWKREKVQRDLEKIGGVEDILVKDTIGMEEPYGYRNNVQIAVGEKNGKTVVGFYELGTNDIVDMEETILISEEANMALKAIRAWIDQYHIKPYTKNNKKGNLRHIGIRINIDDEIMVILVTKDKELPYVDKLVGTLKENNVVSLYQNINNTNTSVTFGEKYNLLYGKDSLVDTIGKYKFKVSPSSFLQVNRIQSEVLYDKAMEYLNPEKEDRVVDLYSGIGTISLYMADRVKEVAAIESVEAAVKDAKYNAKLNDVENINFFQARAEVLFPKLAKDDIKINKIILDPPRKGCDPEILEAIVDLGPERVVYVSCNPSTLARDIKYLSENGYKLQEVQPVDMFPHTSHVECVVGIQRIKSSK